MAVLFPHILEAQSRIRDHIVCTPLHYSEKLSREMHAHVYLKYEHLQKTGSFKPRGAFNRLLQLSSDERERGVVCATAGNHGMGLTYAATELGVPCYVCLPDCTDCLKITFLEQHKGRLQFVGAIDEAERLATKLAHEHDLTMVSAYNDPAIIAADGTIALEIFDTLPKPDMVICPVGGGGLISGIGIVAKTLRPQCCLIGVQAENSPVMTEWYRARRVVDVKVRSSIAEGLAGAIVEKTITLPIMLQVVDQMQLASEDHLVAAMTWFYKECGTIIEPSGAAALAWLWSQPNVENIVRNKTIVIIVSGGNISEHRFAQLVPDVS